jgi:hypothetical protein
MGPIVNAAMKETEEELRNSTLPSTGSILRGLCVPVINQMLGIRWLYKDLPGAQILQILDGDSLVQRLTQAYKMRENGENASVFHVSLI